MQEISSRSWIIWLALGPLLGAVVAATPQPRRSERQLFDFFSGSSTPTVVNCMTETSESLVTWQNPDFPANESLPGICTLTLNPADGTCAYRLHFDNMDLQSTPSLVTSLACSTDKPYLKVSTVDYTAPAKCQNLTGYEGIVQLPENSNEPVVLLLQTDPSANFTFRVNISSVACVDIKTFTSDSVCGIRNQIFNEEEDGRSDITLQESSLLESEPKDNARVVNSLEIQKKQSGDTALEELEDSPVEITETLEKARKGKTLSDVYSANIHKSYPDSAPGAPVYPDAADTDSINSEFRRLPVEQAKKKKKQNAKQKVKTQTEPDNIIEISNEAKEYAEKLKKAGNIFSFGIAVGIEKGELEYLPREQNDTRFWWEPTIPPNPNERPWMVLIEASENEIRCNGVLLDESHVITAATCLQGVSLLGSSVDNVRVILGAHDVPIDEDDTDIIIKTVSKITFPMSYNLFEVKDDIVVLTLSESVNFTEFVRPICVPVSYNNPQDELGIGTGWPVDQFYGTSLQALEAKVLDKERCNETISLYMEFISQLTGEIPDLHPDNYVCALEAKTDLSVCGVGPGTPLVRQDITNAYYLYGIAGPPLFCGTSAPNIFTAIKPDDTFLNLALAG